ncbi:MAG TPA: L-seryl-tRNA(Sec) selenium transferase [Planctomycetota bacterium]|nr:L-seryl-tRNA(Sec) selenium transferase [Planctomycetota bacterium]
MVTENKTLLRRIPSVEVLMQESVVQKLVEERPRRVVLDSVRIVLDELRTELLENPPEDVSDEAIRRTILTRVAGRVAAASTRHYRRVINATGIILHTGLGRAVLAERALRHITEELSGYSLLQTDPETGARSKRDGRIEDLLRQLTGGEAATVVNNNAAATMLVLNTVAKGREVLVSRGQLVEIGGSFRLPEVMAASGAVMIEVGTTNKTHPRDYERAINGNTAAILRVHPSNYKLIGFTSEVSLAEMVAIAHARDLVLIDDVGAGALIDFSRFGFAHEPTIPESIAAGADIVTSSADKLIGAAQGGLIVGRTSLIDRVRKNPIARMVRVDKMTLAALEATLSLFLDDELALREVPTLRMLRRGLPEIEEQARRIAEAIPEDVPASVAVIDGFSQMGSGSLPEQNLATRLVAVAPKSMTPDEFARRLRDGRPAVFARIQKDLVLLDPRTLLEGDEEALIHVLIDALGVKA